MMHRACTTRVRDRIQLKRCVSERTSKLRSACPILRFGSAYEARYAHLLLLEVLLLNRTLFDLMPPPR